MQEKILVGSFWYTADIVHQAAGDQQNQRRREAVTNGSDEAEEHQQIIYAVCMDENGA